MPKARSISVMAGRRLPAMVLALALGFAQPSHSAIEAVDRAKVMLSSNDSGEIVSVALPYFYANLSDDHLTPILRAVWREAADQYPTLSWKLLVDPNVKLPFGRLWCQWLKYRSMMGAEFEQVQAYARKYAIDRSPILRASALSLLGSCGSPQDVGLLTNSAVQDTDQNVQVASVFAIYSLLGERAKPILVDLKSKIANPFVLERIDTVLSLSR